MNLFKQLQHGEFSQDWRMAGHRFLLLFALAVLGAGAAYPQDIRIRVLDGRNGHPTSLCLDIRPNPPEDSGPFIIRSGKDGVASLHVGEGPVTRLDRHACKNTPPVANAGPAKMIAIYPEVPTDCRPPSELRKWPRNDEFYSVEEILKQGIATSNTCGKYRAEPKPGELILFVRPLRWWEHLEPPPFV